MISLVIPCYNESANIPSLFEKLKVLKDVAEIKEVILVDNGSSDGSFELMLNCIKEDNSDFFKSIRLDVNDGYGGGILAGLSVAKGDWLAWTHADLQTDPLDMIKGIELKNKETADVVIKGKRMNRPLFDHLFSLLMQFYVFLRLGHYVNEINAQPKIFSRKFYENFLHGKAPKDFSLDLFLLITAKKEGVKILEFPVFFNKRLYGEAKGGGSIKLKVKLSKRTISFIEEMAKKV